MEDQIPAPQIRKTRTIFKEATRDWVDEYEAPDITGGTTRALVSRQASRPDEVAKPLRKAGARLPRNDKDVDRTISNAMESEALIVREAAHTGWRAGRRCFVTHLHVIGLPRDKEEVIPLSLNDHAVLSNLVERGLAEDFATKLGPLAARSSAIMLCLGAVFGAPLLSVLKRQSFGMVLVGKTRGGKSSAQLVAGSVLGFTSENHLPSLNATNPGLLALAPLFNDHAMIVNEVGAARGGKADIYAVLRELTYQLMEGRDVLRHPSWKSTDAESTPFSCVFVFSSEHGPDTWAARSGEMRDPGEIPRLFGVPAYADGKRTIFDSPPGDLTEEAIGEWERRRFAQIRSRVAHYSGAAMTAYAEFLVKERKGLRSRARKLVRRFEEKVEFKDMKPEVRQIASNLGVLYAGARLASEAGLLRCTDHEIGSALRRSFDRVVASLVDDRKVLRSALIKLHRKLAGDTVLRAQEVRAARGATSCDGWREKEPDGIVYTVRAQAILKWLADPLARRLALEWLNERGYITLAKRVARSPSAGLEWVESQTREPASFGRSQAPERAGRLEAPLAFIKERQPGRVAAPRLRAEAQRTQCRSAQTH